jgi:hypothetical protein
VLVHVRDTTLHQPVCVELPVLVAICAQLVAVVVVILIGKAYSDAVLVSISSENYLGRDSACGFCTSLIKFASLTGPEMACSKRAYQ